MENRRKQSFGLAVLVGKIASLTAYVVIHANNGITQAAIICLLKFLDFFKTLKKTLHAMSVWHLNWYLRNTISCMDLRG